MLDTGPRSEAAWQAGNCMLGASDPAHLTFFLNILDIYGEQSRTTCPVGAVIIQTDEAIGCL